MFDIKVEMSGEISKWLNQLRMRSRMSITDTSKATGLDETLLIGWETGFPIPLSDFLILMKVYQVDSTVTGARVKQWQNKYFY